MEVLFTKNHITDINIYKNETKFLTLSEPEWKGRIKLVSGQTIHYEDFEGNDLFEIQNLVEFFINNLL